MLTHGPSGPRETPALVELVDRTGRGVGTMEKLAAHRPPGKRHRAFSLFLMNDAGKLLLQRRAKAKYHSPGAWSNTCCGHPESGVDPATAAARRVMEELGVGAARIELAGIVSYRHEDPRTGLIEDEYNHTLVGDVIGEPSPDESEVDAWIYADAADIDRLRSEGRLSVWFDSVYRTARPALVRRYGAKW